MLYLIYAKHKDDKQFRPLDLVNGVTVPNLIHATVFDKKQKREVEDLVVTLNKDNPDIQFEMRKNG